MFSPAATNIGILRFLNILFCNCSLFLPIFPQRQLLSTIKFQTVNKPRQLPQNSPLAVEETEFFSFQTLENKR